MIELPQTHDTPEFRAAWESWIGYRKKRRLPKYKTDRVLINLLRYPAEAAIKAIDHSLNNEYAGIFPEKFSRETCPRSERLGRDLVRRGRASAPAGKYDNLDAEGALPSAGTQGTDDCSET